MPTPPSPPPSVIPPPRAGEGREGALHPTCKLLGGPGSPAFRLHFGVVQRVHHGGTEAARRTRRGRVRSGGRAPLETCSAAALRAAIILERAAPSRAGSLSPCPPCRLRASLVNPLDLTAR